VIDSVAEDVPRPTFRESSDLGLSLANLSLSKQRSSGRFLALYMRIHGISRSALPSTGALCYAEVPPPTRPALEHGNRGP
jgi:hypothetical protein